MHLNFRGRVVTVCTSESVGRSLGGRKGVRNLNMWCASSLEDELSNFGVGFDGVWGRCVIVEDYGDVAAIVGVDDTPLDCDAFG